MVRSLAALPDTISDTHKHTAGSEAPGPPTRQQVQRSSLPRVGAGGVQRSKRRRAAARSSGAGTGGVQVARRCGAAAFKRRKDAIDGGKKQDTNRRDPTSEYGESKIASLLVYPIFKKTLYFYKVLFPLYIWLKYT